MASCLSEAHSLEERRTAAYNEAIAVLVRQGAPLAAYSIDRRCLFNYTQALSDDGVEALICFACARRFPYIAARQEKNEIRWIHPIQSTAVEMRFCGLSLTKTKEIFGLSEYLNRYGRCGADAPDLTRKMSEFDDWRLIVPWSRESIGILCCPEDRGCKKASCLKGRALCRDCRVPLCRECDAALRDTHTVPPCLPQLSETT